MNFPEQLKYARISRGLSQEALGELAHMSQAQISHYENGRRVPKAEELRILEDVLRFKFIKRRTQMSDENKIGIQSKEELLKGAEELSDKLSVGYSAAQKRTLYLTALLFAGFEIYDRSKHKSAVDSETKQDVTWEEVTDDLYILLENCEETSLYEAVRQLLAGLKDIDKETQVTFPVRAGLCANAAGIALLSIFRHENSFTAEFKTLLSMTSDRY